MSPSPKRLTAAPRNMAIQAIGRDEDVEKIFDKLMQSAQPLVVTGVGGLGKTTVVQLIGQKYENQFDNVAYLAADAFFSDNKAREADNAELFLNAFVNNRILTTKLGVSFDPTDDTYTRFQLVVDALTQIEGRNFLVIDNVSPAAARYFEDLSALTDWKILLTSRDALPNMAAFELRALSPEHAVTLFKRIYQKPVQNEDLTNILRGIGYHTLAIELIAAYAREKNATMPELEKELSERGVRQLDNYNVTSIRDSKGKSVVEHLVRTFLMEFDEKEAEIMRYFSVLPAEGTGLDEKLMTESQLAIYFQKEDTKADLHNTLSNLVRLHWLQKKNNAYACHPIVKEIAHIELKPDAVNCEKLIRSFNKLLYVDQFSNDHILNRKHFEPLAAEILRGCYDEHKTPTESDKVLSILAYHLHTLHWQNGSYYTALKYGEINLKLNTIIYGENHLEVAASYSNLALIYQNLGDLPRAKSEMEKAISIQEAQLDPQHLSLATLYSNLATIYKALGDLPRAKTEMEKAISIKETQLEPQHLSLATSYSNLATIYQALGDLPRAKTEMEKAISIQEAQLDPQHLSLATLYSNLAIIYRDLGDLPKAKTEMEKAITIWEAQLDPQHLNLGYGYNNLANILADMQDLPLAKTYMDKAVTIRQLRLPAEHPHLLGSLKTQATWAAILRGGV